MFPIYKTLNDTSDKKFLKVSLIGLFSACILYCLVGLSGYVAYGNGGIESNYLFSFLPDDRPDGIGVAMYLVLNITFVFSTLFR